MSIRLSDPIHPGEVLADELEAISMNGAELADRLGVPANRIYGILKGERNITADTALRLGKFFEGTTRLWLNLQKSYELDVAIAKAGGTLHNIAAYQPSTN